MDGGSKVGRETQRKGEEAAEGFIRNILYSNRVSYFEKQQFLQQCASSLKISNYAIRGSENNGW